MTVPILTESDSQHRSKTGPHSFNEESKYGRDSKRIIPEWALDEFAIISKEFEQQMFWLNGGKKMK